MPLFNKKDVTDKLLARVAEVEEPYSGRKLSELGMIGRVDESGHNVNLEIKLPARPDDYELVEDLQKNLSVALSDIPADLNVEFTEMSQNELDLFLRALSHGANIQDGFLSETTRIICISSGKGGVGKSTIALNLAASLAKSFRVGLLDADIYGSSIPTMLQTRSRYLVAGGIVLPPKSFGFRYVSAGIFAEDGQPIMWRGPMLHKAIEQFLKQVFWDDPELLIVDMPPGTGDVLLSFAALTNKVENYVVTTPQRAATSVAKKAALAAKHNKQAVRGVIENMSYLEDEVGTKVYVFGSGGGKNLANELGVELIGEIPIDVKLRESVDEGYPLCAGENPGSRAFEALEKLAKSIAEKGPTQIRKKELRISG